MSFQEKFEKDFNDILQMRAELAKREAAVRGDAIATIQGMIDTLNIRADELVFGDAVEQPKKVKGKAAPKYRGPNGELWSGRGRTPSWMAALEEAGRSREEFLI